MRFALPLALLGLLASLAAMPAPAQPAAAPLPPKPLPPPQLMAGENGNAPKPLALAKADILVRVAGTIAETTLTLTFKNDLGRVLEGELVFPLPEGATVSGYGLDVNGSLVEGVPVPKQKARVSYESEVRRRVDPGLVEQAVGNNFRTRVYPIPAHGTRTVRVQYLSDLTEANNAASYHLPLTWGEAVGECNVRLEVAKASAPAAPAARGGQGDGAMTFNVWQEQYVAERQFRNVKLDSDLTIAIPQAGRAGANVEKRHRATQSVDSLIEGKAADFDRAEYYFVLNDRQGATKIDEAPAKKAARVGILWDASLSRLEADKAREYDLIRKIVEGMDPAGGVDVIPFRNVADATASFEAKNGAGPIIEYLQHLVYEGGTNLSVLQAPRELPSARAITAGPGQYDYWLLFSDGIADLGPEKLAKVETPLYAISNDAKSNHALLRRVASESGGAYFNLQRISNDTALGGIGQSPCGLVGVDYKEGEIADLYPRGSQAVPAEGGRVTLSGRLLVPEAKVTLKYGRGSAVWKTINYTLKQADATDGNLVPRFWAQQKVADLSAEEEKNADELAEVGREFNLVTPNTSLIVLETVEQYLEHQIVPPRSRADVYAAFMQRIEGQKANHKRTQEEQLTRVLGLWDARVKWWEAEYKYPKDLKVKEELAKRDGQGEGALGPTTQPPLPTADARPNSSGRDLRRWQDAQESSNPRMRVPAAGAAAPASPPRPNETRDLADAPALESVARRAGGEGRRAGGGGLFGASGDDKEAGKSGDEAEGVAPLTIAIKEWDPNTPYLAAMKAVPAERAYGVYLDQRKAYLASPAFYLDCADYLLRNNQRDLGMRVLTNVAELKLENAQLLRIVAHRMEQVGDLNLAIDLFEKVLKMRPEEPQSYRDLALALADRVDAQHQTDAANYLRPLELLNKVIMTHWDRFDEIELTALMEANQIVAKMHRLPQDIPPRLPLDARLVKNLDLDVRIVLTWDADATDVDLWVVEPSGEKCFYGHNRTTIGGLLSKDFTQGYGPEEYCLRRAMAGQYKIQANYYGSTQAGLVGPATVQATVITNFGRADEKRQALTLRLAQTKDVVDVGTVTLGGEEKKADAARP